MNNYRFKISLRIWHPSKDPEEFTRLLGRAPDLAVKAGDPRTTPRGTPLSGHYPQSSWGLLLVEGGPAEPLLPRALETVVHDLTPHGPLFNRVRMEGGGAELFIGWFLDGNSGDEFPAALLSSLGRLGLDLSFDVYPPRDTAPE